MLYDCINIKIVFILDLRVYILDLQNKIVHISAIWHTIPSNVTFYDLYDFDIPLQMGPKWDHYTTFAQKPLRWVIPYHYDIVLQKNNTSVPLVMSKFHYDVIKWNIFCVTDPLWGESTSHRLIALIKASEVEL